jgi:hypothetical protein
MTNANECGFLTIIYYIHCKNSAQLQDIISEGIIKNPLSVKNWARQRKPQEI